MKSSEVKGKLHKYKKKKKLKMTVGIMKGKNIKYQVISIIVKEATMRKK